MPFFRTPEGHYRPVVDPVPEEPKAKKPEVDPVPEEPAEEKTKKHGGKK